MKKPGLGRVVRGRVVELPCCHPRAIPPARRTGLYRLKRFVLLEFHPPASLLAVFDGWSNYPKQVMMQITSRATLAMSNLKTKKLADFSAAARVVRSISAGTHDTVDVRRKVLADFCKSIGRSLGQAPIMVEPGHGLPPRLRDTLRCLLAGDSEKQVASRLILSPHTVHVYVKKLYKLYDVNSRSELLAKCLGGSTAPATGGRTA